MPELHASLDFPVPDELEVGGGTALLIGGTCFSPQGRLAALEIHLGDAVTPVRRFGMPRLDFFAALHPTVDPYATAALARDPASAEDPLLHAYRSGFWAVVPIPARLAAGAVALRLRARLADGSAAEAELARPRLIAASPDRPPAAAAVPAAAVPAADVTICMASYEPPPELFAAQIETIRAQTHGDWHCVISDDGSSPRALAEIRRVLGDDPRFTVRTGGPRLGFARNFARALALVPAGSPYVALADQDDRWHPEKLARLRAAIGGAELVYSDARLVDPGGAVLAETYWSTRRNNHEDMLSLLVANAVSGAATLMRREVLDTALPFPPAQFAHFHDHWLALCARARGEIRYLPEPLYDYVQHGEASLGHAAANRMTSLTDRVRRPLPVRERIRRWRLHSFVDAARLETVATILLLRAGDGMAADVRRALEGYLAADRSPVALARLAARGARELLATTPETLGAEWMLFHAFAWRRLLALTARDRPHRGLRLDAVPPPDLALAPGRTGPDPAIAALAAKIAPLPLAVSEAEPRRINILVPEIDVRHFFGGYIAKLNLAARLADRGHRVRLVTTDPGGPLPPGWRAEVEAYGGLAGLFDRVELAVGRGGGPLRCHPDDGLVATTWWTAHIAHAAAAALGGRPFLYLIQEYEPFTFPMGSYAALAAASYRYDHDALFSSELLRAYFRAERIGVYGDGPDAGDARSAAFANAITAVTPPTAAELAARPTRRLLFYARPEPHAARNLFELGALALTRAAAEGILDGVELRGIGSVGPGQRLALGAGRSLELLPRSDQRSYGELLRAHDIGLALMHTPHPSLVPIEMASAGLVTVTTTFATKTAAALRAISGNLIAVEATPEALADGLRTAVARADDPTARVRGSAVAWSREWTESFDDALLERVEAWLGYRAARTSGSR